MIFGWVFLGRCPRLCLLWPLAKCGVRVPQTEGCALGYQKTALQAWIAKIRTAHSKDSQQRNRGSTGVAVVRYRAGARWSQGGS
jgi:hypothetical protein